MGGGQWNQWGQWAERCPSGTELTESECREAAVGWGLTVGNTIVFAHNSPFYVHGCWQQWWVGADCAVYFNYGTTAEQLGNSTHFFGSPHFQS